MAAPIEHSAGDKSLTIPGVLSNVISSYIRREGRSESCHSGTPALNAAGFANGQVEFVG